MSKENDSGRYKMQLHRNHDGGRAKPDVWVDGELVCEGLIGYPAQQRLQRLVTLANSASELMAALEAIHAVTTNPSLSEEDADYDSHVAATIKSAESAIAKAKGEKIKASPSQVSDTKLIEFAKNVLWRLESEEEWSSETLDAIASYAFGAKLAENNDDGMFTVNKKVVKL